MKPVRYLLVLAAVVLLFCFAGAQEHGHGAPSAQHGPAQEHAAAGTGGEHAAGHGEDHHAQFKYSPSVQWISRATGIPVTSAYWVALCANFLIVAGVVGWLWKSNIPQMFRARTASIQKGMEEARRASEEATMRLSAVEGRLSRLDAEIASLRSQAESEAAAEEARIRAAAEEEQRKILEASRQEIEAASKQARRELQAYAADLAVSLAARQIQVDAAADRALVGNFVEQLANGEGRG